MKSVFDFITRTALRFRLITIGLIVTVMLLGTIAATELKQELLPPIEFPQTIILAQVGGMSGEQVLSVVTTRLEAALQEVPEIVNIESTTNGAIGAIITAANEFGLDQDELQERIQDALDSVWFPTRAITAPDGADGEEFARQLLGEVDAEVLLFLASSNESFLFQLSPDVWSALSDDTTRALLGYLANQYAESGSENALAQLVEQEVIPQLNSLDLIANVQVDGGQQLPDEAQGEAVTADASETVPRSRLLQLSPEVWQIVSEKLPELGALDDAAVETAQSFSYTVPESAPELPQSWQMDRFSTAADLREVSAAAGSLGNVFNNFVQSGQIKGAIGQTDDLTPEIVTRLLELEPTLVEDLTADQLAAMSADVFDVLPEDYIASLDGFTRDALAASALARSLTGESDQGRAVLLPQSWRVQPPRIIRFSFADIPLATFSVFRTGEIAVTDAPEVETGTPPEEVPDTVQEQSDIDTDDLPVGPELPQIYQLMGEQFGAELDTADDLVQIDLSGEFADQLGADSLSAAAFFNLLPQFSSFMEGGAGAEGAGGFDTADITAFVPALAECGVGLLQVTAGNFDLGETLVTCLEPEVFAYLVEQDPTFATALSADVYAYFTDEVYEVEGLSPLLGDVWSTLNSQPQFADDPLQTADDLIELGDGQPSSVLNTINEATPSQFEGYEVRLFDSLTPGTIRYLQEAEPGFFSNLTEDVLVKFSPEALAEVPDDVLSTLSNETADEVTAIAAGTQPSAMDELSALYTSDVPPADPDAPPLNAEWQFIVDFVPGADALDNAYDFFRFEATKDVAAFINAFFDGPGASFATDLLGNLSPEAFNYIAERDPNFISDLSPQALQLLPPEIYDNLPQSAKDRAEAGVVFSPTELITRTNGSSSLLVTVYKESEANTVEAWYQAQDVIRQIDNQNDNIDIEVAFEQSSFVEESIAGVVREGSLGALFAVINILIFLSGGLWLWRGRRMTGFGLMIISIALMMVVVGVNLDAAGGDFGLAFQQSDTVMRILAIVGLLAGVVLMVYPGSLPYPAWRSTLVIAISIPLSIFSALAMMHWLPFADGLTLNIMTLSGLTVAVGRVVDDSIVVLENIFRQLQTGMDKRDAIISGVRDVSVAIFSATGIAVVVFLPLGLTGGLIGEFFLPFGLAVTYSLISSFFVAITVVPVLAYTFISVDDVPEERDTWMQRAYVPVLKGVLANRWTHWGVVLLAFVSAGIGGYLLSQRPAAFLPDFGEPQIVVSVSLPQGTSILETNEKVREIEAVIDNVVDPEDISTVRTSVGGGGFNLEALFGTGSVSENVADITVGLESQEDAEAYTHTIRDAAIEIFGEEYVTVSAATLTSAGFGGFEIVVSGPDQDVLVALDPEITAALETVSGLTNISSNLAQAAAAGEDAPQTYIRINGQPALSYTAELETEDTINVTQTALEAVKAQVDLPEGVTVGQGFDSELQTEGFASLFVAMGIAILIVIVILIVVFRSPVYWLAIILSIVVAPVGAAVALALADRVLGISALIGLLMLLGLVVTNAIVLIDRVGSNRDERGMNLYDALVEGGARRLRPILMTAIATMIALMPLAVGLSEGAIIAKELGTVVIGGVLSSTLLTLIVVPAAYYLLTPLHNAFLRLIGRGSKSTANDVG